MRQCFLFKAQALCIIRRILSRKNFTNIMIETKLMQVFKTYSKSDSIVREIIEN